MYCQNKIVHTIQAGDSLYKLSKQYNTTVTELILGNPGVNPYNLLVGMQMNVCPGAGYEPVNADNRNWSGNVNQMQNEMEPPNGNSVPPTNQNPMDNREQSDNQNPTDNQNPMENDIMPDMRMPVENAVSNLMDEMRLAWLNHIFWGRMYLVSAVADAKDQQALEEQSAGTADEIADVFTKFLPIHVARQLRSLLMEHEELTGEIIRALHSGNTENLDALVKDWYANANQIADLLGNQNPYFAGRETRKLLLNHLDLLREEIEHQINGEYTQSIDTFRDLENETLELAEHLARGLLAR